MCWERHESVQTQSMQHQSKELVRAPNCKRVGVPMGVNNIASKHASCPFYRKRKEQGSKNTIALLYHWLFMDKNSTSSACRRKPASPVPTPVDDLVSSAGLRPASRDVS